MKTFSPTCRVLVAGSCHTYAYGIPFERGFVQRTLANIDRVEQPVRADYYTPLKINQFVRLIQRDPALLDNYDLIVLQFGHFELLSRSFGHLFQTDTGVNAGIYGAYNAIMDVQTTPSDVNSMHTRLPNKCGPIADNRRANGSQSVGQHLRAWLAATCVYGIPFPYLRQVARQWHALLDLLAEHRDRIVLVSPLPTADPITNSLRAWGRRWLRREAGRRYLSIIDPAKELRTDGACLLADGFHLNSRGHFLVYQALRTAVPVQMLTNAAATEA